MLNCRKESNITQKWCSEKLPESCTQASLLCTGFVLGLIEILPELYKGCNTCSHLTRQQRIHREGKCKCKKSFYQRLFAARQKGISKGHTDLSKLGWEGTALMSDNHSFMTKAFYTQCFPAGFCLPSEDHCLHSSPVPLVRVLHVVFHKRVRGALLEPW